MTHELKIMKRWFEDVQSGKKNFEIRRSDRDFKVGDLLLLQEYDHGKYTGREITREVEYIYKGDGTYGVSDMFWILGLKQEPCDEQSVYMRAYREGYDKGYSDGDFFARHEDEIREPCEDAVKREAVLNTLDTMDKALDENRTVEAYKELLKECYKELPPVTPKQRTGKWIEDVVRDDFIDYEDIFYVCDCCNESACQPYKYCPNCGVKMEGE